MNQTPAEPHFSGSIPGNYDQYLAPMFFEPYAQDVVNRIDSSAVSNALEIGCGTGRVTRHLNKILSPVCRFVASDISPDMLAIAKERLSGANIDWKIIDAETLPFEHSSIDLIVCYFGYMFVPDKVKAYAEAMRVLRKGGMLLMATWDKLEHNEASFVFRKTVKNYLGDTLPEWYKLPFSMHDPGSIKKMLIQAGFVKVSSEGVLKMSYAESAAKAAQGLVKGGSLYNEILKRNPAWVDEIISIVENELGEKYGKVPTEAPMSAFITQGWK
ncbi:MAG TPA: class I SAM-dependent methyltransferase [Flavitalea sp.]|nr:class I SAM-dependent methyltransferase [Flavitalea sp.]